LGQLCNDAGESDFWIEQFCYLDHPADFSSVTNS